MLDEIQLFPQARQALKTLLEDGRYDYLETGSLAGITKRSKDILIPSEEYTLEVQPLDFEEFLWASEDTFTMPLMRGAASGHDAIVSRVHAGGRHATSCSGICQWKGFWKGGFR